MIKTMLLFPLIYSMGVFIGSFGNDVHGVGLSTSVLADSSIEIENRKSVARPILKRAQLALLVPLNDVDESSEEHYKSKRCWRANSALEKVRLSDLYPQDMGYDLNKLNEHEKRSVEESDEESWRSDESSDDDFERKYPLLRIVRVKNPRKNLKEFLRADGGVRDKTLNLQSGEDPENVTLRRVKNHLNPDDYNVFALVGKRARHPLSNLNKKYICYCRDAADCSGANCRRMMYRPCSNCKNSRPLFWGKANNQYCSHGGRNNQKNDEGQSADARMPLKIQYPHAASENRITDYSVNTDLQLKKNPELSLPAITVDKLGYKGSQHVSPVVPVVQDRRYQFSYHTPKMGFENPNNNVKPWNQFGILHAPMSTKSATDSGTSANGYPSAPGKPARNEYRNENMKFTPDRSAYNQWAVNSYYPMIGGATNREIQNTNYGTDRKKSNNMYKSDNELTSRNMPYANGGIIGFSYPESPGTHLSQTNFRTTGPKTMTNFLPISNNKYYNGNHDLRWNIPTDIRTHTHPLPQQDIKTPVKMPSYQKKPASPLTQSSRLYDREDHKVEEHTEGKISGSELETDDHYTSTENNFDSVTRNSDELYDDDSEDSGYEGDDIIVTENIFTDRGESIDRSIPRTEGARNFDYAGVSDEPQKYKIPIIYVKKIDNPAEYNEFSDSMRDRGTFVPKNLDLEGDWIGSSTHKANSATSLSSTTADYNIIGNKNADRDDEEGNLGEYNSFEAQLERPVNGKTNRDKYNDDSTAEVKIEEETNDDLFHDVSSTSEETESRKLTGDDYSDIQVITNGYFTSKTYDDFEETENGDNGVNEFHLQRDDVSTNDHGDLNNDSLYSPLRENQTESLSQDDDAAMTIDEPPTVDYSDGRIFDLSNHEQSGRDDLPELPVVPGNQLIDVDSEHIKFDDAIEWPEKSTETFFGKSVEKQETGSSEYGPASYEAGGNYGIDSWREEMMQNHHEGDAGKAVNNFSSTSTTDENKFEEYSQLESIESREHFSNSANVFADHFREDDNPKIFSHPNSKTSIYKSEETEKVAIEDSPTRYFSPNDIVLKYIKKHGQDLEGTFYPAGTEKDLRYVTPTIYHTNLDENQSAKPDHRGFDYRSESDEIISQPSDDGSDSYENENGNSDEHETLSASADHKISLEEDDTVIEAPQYVNRDYATSSNCRQFIPEIQTIDFKGPGNLDSVGKPHRIAPEGSMRGLEDHGDYENGYEYSLEVDKNDRYVMSGELDDRSEEFYGSDGHEFNDNFKLASEREEESVGNDVEVNSDGKTVIVDTTMLPKTEDSVKMTESYENNAEESTHGNGLGNILHHINRDYETTAYRTVEDSTEGNNYYHTNEENYSPNESSRKDAAEHTTNDIWSNYYDSVESTDDYTLLGDSKEQTVDLDNEKSGIIHTKNEYRHHIYDYAGSTQSSTSSEESFESSTDYGTGNLSLDKYNTQYNERGNKELVGKTTSRYSDGLAEQKSSSEDYSNNEKLLVDKFLDSSSVESGKANDDGEEIVPKDFQNHFSSLYEKMNTFEAHTAQPLNYGHSSIHENPSSDTNNLKKDTPNREIIGAENHATELTDENSKPEEAEDENTPFLPQIVESHKDDYLNSRSEYEGDREEHDTIELRTISSSAERSTENVQEVSSYYTTQGQDSDDSYFSTKDTGAHGHESRSQILLEKNIDHSYKPQEDSGEIKSVKFVGSPHSKECCTKPPEVQGDLGYLGRLKTKESNADIKSLGDLVDSDLFYIGDGVKLPLTIKKLKDGSFALSLSDKICEHRLEKECPCCVPREGRILQEKHSEENNEKSSGKKESSNLHRRAIPDDEESEIDKKRMSKKSGLNDVEKKRNHSKRAARSISMPVDEFAEKYNLILNLNEQLSEDRGDVKAAISDSQILNVIEKDEVTKDDVQSEDNDIVEKLLLINDQIPENERKEVLLSTLGKWIASKPAEVDGLVNNGLKKSLRGIKASGVENDQEDSELQDKEARYGYQRDNPILNRIKIIKQLQDKASRCEHRYQKDCHDAITQKTELLTMILYWLKKLVISQPS